MYGRYAHTGESVFAPLMRYCRIRLELDPTQTFPINTVFYYVDRSTHLPIASIVACRQVPESSRTFRGTLIDGVLQPNVRLGNGLELSIDPPDALDTPPQVAQVAKKKAIPQQGGIREQRTTTAPRKSRHQQKISQQKKTTNLQHSRHPIHQHDLSLDRRLHKAAGDQTTSSGSAQQQKGRQPRHPIHQHDPSLDRRLHKATGDHRTRFHSQQNSISARSKTSSSSAQREKSRQPQYPIHQHDPSLNRRLYKAAGDQTTSSGSAQQQKGRQPRYLSASNIGPRAAQLEARERELKQLEDTFHWKRKPWRPEQDLAKVRTKLRSNAHEHAPQSRPAVDASKSKPVYARRAGDTLRTHTRPQTPPGEIQKVQARRRGRAGDTLRTHTRSQTPPREIRKVRVRRRGRPEPKSSEERKKEREAKKQEAKEREAKEREAKEREAKKREAKEREAKAEAEPIFKLINQDDTMPSNALELLRKVRRKLSDKLGKGH